MNDFLAHLLGSGVVASASIIATTAVALLIGAGVVPWSYWSLLATGIPGTIAILLWTCLFLYWLAVTIASWFD